MLISFPRQCKVARRLSIPTCSRANCSLSLSLCPSQLYLPHPISFPPFHLGASSLLSLPNSFSRWDPDVFSPPVPSHEQSQVSIPRTMMSQGVLFLHSSQVIACPVPHSKCLRLPRLCYSPSLASWMFVTTQEGIPRSLLQHYELS